MVQNGEFPGHVILQWTGYGSDEGTIEARFTAQNFFAQEGDTGYIKKKKRWVISAGITAFRLYSGRNSVLHLYYVLTEEADRGGHVWTER